MHDSRTTAADRRFPLSVGAALVAHLLAGVVVSADPPRVGADEPLEVAALADVEIVEAAPEVEPARDEGAGAERPSATVSRAPRVARRPAHSPAPARARETIPGATTAPPGGESPEAAGSASGRGVEPGDPFGPAADGQGASGTVREGAVGASGVAVGARLLARSARCNDLFPLAGTGAASARVTLRVDVAPDGTAPRATVVGAASAEDELRQAARFCARRLRFVPARDPMGRAVASAAVVRLAFARN